MALSKTNMARLAWLSHIVPQHMSVVFRHTSPASNLSCASARPSRQTSSKLLGKDDPKQYCQSPPHRDPHGRPCEQYAALQREATLPDGDVSTENGERRDNLPDGFLWSQALYKEG